MYIRGGVQPVLSHLYTTFNFVIKIFGGLAIIIIILIIYYWQPAQLKLMSYFSCIAKYAFSVARRMVVQCNRNDISADTVGLMAILLR